VKVEEKVLAGTELELAKTLTAAQLLFGELLAQERSSQCLERLRYLSLGHRQSFAL